MKLTRKEIAWMVAGVLAIGMFLGVALCCFVYLNSAEAEGSMHYYCWILCKPEDGESISEVYIREKPGKSGNVTGSAGCGKKMETDWETRGTWIHVIDLATENGEGWVYGGYVVFSEPEIIMEEREIVGGGRVRCRKCIDGEFKGWAANGSSVMVYAMADGWAVTEKGYIQSRFIGGGE